MAIFRNGGARAEPQTGAVIFRRAGAGSRKNILSGAGDRKIFWVELEPEKNRYWLEPKQALGFGLFKTLSHALIGNINKTGNKNWTF